MNKLTVAIFGILLSLGAYAQDSSRESVEELLRVSHMDSMVDGMYGQVNQMIEGMAKQFDLKPDEQPLFEEYMRKALLVMREDMGWEKMKGPLIDIYMKHYTEKEIRDMVDFYNSETGRSMVAKMPAVMTDAMKLSQEILKSYLPKIQSLAEDFQVKLKKNKGQK